MLWGSGRSVIPSYGFGKLLVFSARRLSKEQVPHVWKVEGAFEVVGWIAEDAA